MSKMNVHIRPLVWVLIVAFLFTTVYSQPLRADTAILPAPGQLVPLTPSHHPTVLRGLKVYKDNPFKFDFILSQGDSMLSSEAKGESTLAKEDFLKLEAKKLIGYFLASLTTPEKDMWVNLSPYEKDRIVPKEFGQTEMGKEMLVQDYLLKQVTASVMYPEGAVGKEFWRTIYKQAYEKFGTSQISVDTFNKVWIVPDKAVVFENAKDNTVFVQESRLKVMLEEDYLAQRKSSPNVSIGDPKALDARKKHSGMTKDIIRQIILPALEKEVNEGKNFASLRQVYQSLILATWYKNKLKQSLIGKGYVDRKKISGVDVENKNVHQDIYDQYVTSFKKGVYNYIKEEIAPESNQAVPRKYFSGGVNYANMAMVVNAQIVRGADAAQMTARTLKTLKLTLLSVGLAAVMAGGMNTADAKSPFADSGAQYVEMLAKSDQNVASIQGVGQGADVYEAISNAIKTASRNKAIPGIKGIDNLANQGVLYVDGNKVMNVRQLNYKPGQSLSVMVDYKEVRALSMPPQPSPQVSLEKTIVEVKPGDTVTSLFRSLNPRLTQVDLQRMLDNKVISVQDANGQDIPNANLNRIYPKQKIVFDFTAYAGNQTSSGQSSAGASAPPKPPDTMTDSPSVTVQSATGIRTNQIENQSAPAIVTPSTIASNVVAPALAGATGQSEANAELERERARIQATINQNETALAQIRQEQRVLNDQIRKNRNATAIAITPEEQSRIDAELIADYKLTVVGQPNVSVFDQWPPFHGGSALIAPVIPEYRANAVSVAYVNYEIQRKQAMLKKYTGKGLPASVSGQLNFNRTPLSGTIGSGPTTLAVVPDIPFRGALEFANIARGLGSFGSASLMGKIGAPLVGGQFILDLINYAKMHPARGQDLRYDTRMTTGEGILQSLTIERVPVLAYDQQGNRMEENLYNVGLLKTAKAIFGTLDGLLGDIGIIGDSRDKFIRDVGYQLEIRDYHKAFAVQAALNTDPNKVYINTYRIEDSHARYRKNSSGGWDPIGMDVPYDPVLDYFATKADGFVLTLDPKTNTVTGQLIYTAPTFVNGKFAQMRHQQAGTAVTSIDYLTKPFAEVEASISDLENERRLIKGIDDQGRMIWGALRHPVTRRIVQLVTDANALNNMSSLKDQQGNVVQFIPGAAFQPETGIGPILRDYTVNEFTRVIDKWRLGQTTQDRYANYDLSHRPQLTSLPEELKQQLLIASHLFFDPSGVLKAVNEAGSKYYGVIYFTNGLKPAPLTSMTNVRTISSLGVANGVSKATNGMYMMDGFNKALQSNTLVLVHNGKAIGLIDPSERMRQERIVALERLAQQIAQRTIGLANYGVAINANGVMRPLIQNANEFQPAKYVGAVGQRFGVRNPVEITSDMMVKVVDGKVVEILEIGEKTNLSRQIIIKTLNVDGGFEVEDQRTGKFLIVARGNDLTPEQKAAGILPEKYLADLVRTGQAEMVTVEGTDKLRFIILKEIPPSSGLIHSSGTLASSEQSIPAPRLSVTTVADQPIPTLLASNGQPFHGVTIDAETFRESDITRLHQLGATGVRSYYPIDINVAQRIVDQTNVKTVIVSIPLNDGAYYPENLKKFWGGAVPQGASRISITRNNYIPYVKQLLAAMDGKADVVIELLNEPNMDSNYPRWVGKPANDQTYQELFALIDQHAKLLHNAFGSKVKVVTTLMDRKDHFSLAAATAVDAIGINYYRHNTSLVKDFKELGITKPVFIAEAGTHSQTGQNVQRTMVENDWRDALRMRISIMFMSLSDNSAKVGVGEQSWGWAGKPVFNQMAYEWGAANTPLPTPAASNDTLAGINENYAVIRWKNGRAERIRRDDLNRNISVLMNNAQEILKIGPDGETVGRFVKMYGGGYELWTMAEMDNHLRTHFLVVPKNGQGSEYITIEQLKDPRIHELVRRSSKEITMRDMSGKVVGEVYQSMDFNGSRVVLTGSDGIGKVFDLISLSLSDLNNPIAVTSSRTDANGLLHIATTDQREVNKGITVEDVSEPVPGARPIKLYSIRPLQQETIHFLRNGHERYSVSNNISSEAGQTVGIDGQEVKNVTGIYDFDEVNNIGYHVSLRDIERNGWHAPIRRTSFKEGQINDDQTGFVKLEPGLNANQIMERIRNVGVFNVRDVWIWGELGRFSKREISLSPNGNWIEAWTLTGGENSPQAALVNQVLKNAIIAQSFAKYGINANTVFSAAIKVTPNGVRSTDYRILGDVLERKVITVIEEAGVVVKLVVGLAFDPRTGQQTLSYELTPDGQVRGLSRTIPNNEMVGDIMAQSARSVYAEIMNRHFNSSSADLWSDLFRLGVSKSYKPVTVETIPFNIKSDNPQLNGYESSEPLVRPLVTKLMAADDHDRPAILEQIEEVVRQHNMGKAHFSNQEGKATLHHLLPNDSRGRDLLRQLPNGEKALDLWWLEGKGQYPSNILPGTIIFDASGQMKYYMLYKETREVISKDSQNISRAIKVNVYQVYGHPSLKEMAFTGSGNVFYETTNYVRNRVMNGILGVQWRGLETTYYTPLLPISLPLYGILDENGQPTKITLNMTYQINGEVISTALEREPTAPRVYNVTTQIIRDGQAVEGSKKKEDVFKGYWNDIKDQWLWFTTMPGLLAGLFFSGDLIRKRRLAKIKQDLQKENSQELRTNSLVVEQQQRNITLPSWNAYGFSEDVVNMARDRFNGSVAADLANEPLEEVLAEHFQGYQVWRKVVMNINEPFIPTIEDLWVFFLIDIDSDVLRGDMPDKMSELFHKSIEARQKGKGEGIRGYVRKEYMRWHNILEYQQTSFQGLSAGIMKHVVPYDLYLRGEDIQGMFATRAFIEWYDSLGYSLDGEQDLRSAIYDDLIQTMKLKVNQLKAALEVWSKENNIKNIFRLKRGITDLKEYHDYVDFFQKVQQGQYRLSDDFKFGSVTKQEVERLIRQKALIIKTASDSGASIGRMPLPLRYVKALAQMVRNSYGQLTNFANLSLTTGLMMAAYSGMMTWMAAAISAGLALALSKALYYPLSYMLDKDLNTHSHGKPVDFWEGYERAKPTIDQKWYRRAFWSIAVPIKVGWDAFLFYYFLIVHNETIGAVYQPSIMGNEIPVNLNSLLMISQWTTPAFFIFLSSWSVYYAVSAFFSYIHGAIRGLGTIKSAKDIRSLAQGNVLQKLEEKTFLAKDLNLDETQRQTALGLFHEFIANQDRRRDEISDEEMIQAKEGKQDHYHLDYIQERKARAVNALLMKKPDMVRADQIQTATDIIPVYGEDIILAYKDTKNMPTSLDKMLNTGYTNLNYIISRAKGRWENLIERSQREGFASADEIERMKVLLNKTGQLGDLNPELEMQIRLWASYEWQPFVRTLDGMMNYVRALHVHFKINHPDWSKEKIQEETNKKYQLLWAYQVWGEVLNSKDDKPDMQLKRADTLYLLRKYYNELGFLIDIASLQSRNGINYKVLSRYNPLTDNIEDVYAIEMTENKSIVGEGKSSNQMHASTFARYKINFTKDMNMDFAPEQAIKMPILLEEFKDKKIAAVNFPEDIFTGRFSIPALFHKIADRTFNTSTKRNMSMLLSAFHHGHPDGWRASILRIIGGLSSIISVTEDYIGGLRAVIRGYIIKNVEYIEMGKAREASFPGTEGIFRKFAMGAPQFLLSRYAQWNNKYFGPTEGAAEFISGPAFFLKETVAAFGLISFLINSMILGIGAFAAFPSAVVVAMAGTLVVGQAITLTGFTQMALESGVKKSIKTFGMMFVLMAPFFIAHIFTYEAGFLSGLAGVAAYVATGRGLNRENMDADVLIKSFSKSHIAPGVILSVLAFVGVNIWWNWSFILSSFVFITFVSRATVPIIANPGNFPGGMVSVKTSFDRFQENKTKVKDLLVKTYTEGYKKKNYREIFYDAVAESIGAGWWYVVTASVQYSVKGAVKLKETFIAPVPDPVVVDKAIVAEETSKGGIDFGKADVIVHTNQGITMPLFTDPAMLRLLLNAEGLMPIIYDIKVVTPGVVDQWVGLN